MQAWIAIQQAATESGKTEDEYQDLFIGIGHGEVVPFGSYRLALNDGKTIG